MRLVLPLLLPCALAAPLWGLEETDLRLHGEIWTEDYDIDAFGLDSEEDFDHCIGVRASMVQPLSVLLTGDLIAVLGLSYVDAKDDGQDLSGTDFVYQGATLRYGFGYRAELGDAFAIDAYPYVGVGWASMEFGDLANDPGLLFEAGAEVDLAVTFDDWQFGAHAIYAFRHSEHTIFEQDVVVEQLGLVVGGFFGYRF